MTTESEKQRSRMMLELLQDFQLFLRDIHQKLEVVEARSERHEKMQRSTLAILNRTPFDRGKAKEP